MIDAGTLSTLFNAQSVKSGDAAIAMARAALPKGQSLDEQQAGQVAKDFEAMFLSQMLEGMFGDSLGSDLFGDEETEQVYKSLMMQEYGKQIVTSGGIGIADFVKRELLKAQEV